MMPVHTNSPSLPRLPDIGPATNWESVLSDVQLVVHGAGLAHQVGVQGRDLEDALDRVNAGGTRSLVEAIKHTDGVTRLVFLSSIAVTGSFAASPAK